MTSASSNNDKIIKTFTFEIPSPKLINVSSYSLYTIDDFGLLSETALPALPLKIYFIEVPYNTENIKVNLNQTKSVYLGKVNNLYPAPELIPGIPDYINYTPPTPIRKNFIIFPTNIIEFEGIKFLRSHKLVAIAVYPLQYNFETNDITYHSNITIDITYTEKPSIEEQKLQEETSFQILKQIVYNSEELLGSCGNFICDGDENCYSCPLDCGSCEYSPISEIKYIIITSTTLQPIFKPLQEWKTKKGIPTRIYNTTWIYNNYAGADNAERIRNFILDMYNNYSIEWVLLGGDTDVVPVRYVRTSACGSIDVVSDYYYADLIGSYSPYDWDYDNDTIYGETKWEKSGDEYDYIDWLPEVYVGRLPISNSVTMQILIDNIINYEKNPPSGIWFKRAVLAHAFLHYDRDFLPANQAPNHDNVKDNDQCDNAKLGEYIRTDFLDPRNIFYDRLYEEGGLDPTNYSHEYALTQANFLSRMNVGESIVSMSGHGSYNVIWRKVWTSDNDGDGFDDEGADDSWYHYFDTGDSISNGNMKPFVYSNACFTGDFDGTEDSLGDHTIKNVGIGFIGATDNTMYSTGWEKLGLISGTQTQEYYFWKNFFQKYKPGQALYDGKVEYLQNLGEFPRNFYVFNLLGDPEIPIRTDIPDNFTVTVHPTQIIVNLTTQMIINLKNDSDGNNVDDAVTCVFGYNIYKHNTTDYNGNISFILNPDDIGNLNLTITKYNFLPKEISVPIVAQSFDNAPIIEFISDITINETNSITINVTASDSDYNLLSFYINDSRFTKNNNLFYWQTSYGDRGNYSVLITVSDGYLNSSQVVALNVLNICTDDDDDGYNVTGGQCGIIDCNDSNASIYPGALELCNGIDDNCNGEIDEGDACLFYFNISLLEGWNLISFPLNLTNKSINYVFSNINYLKIFSYNSSWIELDNNSEINETFGYWIKSLNNQTLTIEGTEFNNFTLNLKPGWNLIGYPTLNEANISEFFKDVNISNVFAYNGSWLSYNPSKSSQLNTLNQLKPGYGYWLKIR